MCRHLGYLGPARSIASVLTAGEHSLRAQSWAPRHMRGGGTMNADGFGACWWGASGVSRHRSAQPIWSDTALGETGAARGVLEDVSAGAVLAAVRSATVGMPVTEEACAPFTDGHWAFSHNGVVRGWPGSMAQLAGELDLADTVALDAPTDSALLWALLRGRLRGETPAAAVRGLVEDVEAVAPGSRLNLLLGDGQRLIATAWDHSLWWRRGASEVVGGEVGSSELWVASEPLDERPDWTEVPDRCLLIADLTQTTIEQIGE
ncbi:ergothioneine biosynthesis protein EgtC [Tomitella biformata]|uniref:ergothioneine biosynthesis protein EgtC n=1 Tax=Tomitella biformata TaxID=630403 RepID=UPI00046674D6|nr:ergothioneine biosynthesis protein EgtC [Tomitella biformata]